jgi:hypothetical protein
MKHLILILGICGVLGCTSTSPVVKTPVIEESKKEVKTKIKKNQVGVGIVRISCISLEYIKNIMEADKVSSTEASKLLKRHINAKVCGIHYPPTMVLLEGLEEEYIDYAGIVTQIWKLKDRNLWTIVAKEYVKLPDDSESEIQEKAIDSSI